MSVDALHSFAIKLYDMVSERIRVLEASEHRPTLERAQHMDREREAKAAKATQGVADDMASRIHGLSQSIKLQAERIDALRAPHGLLDDVKDAIRAQDGRVNKAIQTGSEKQQRVTSLETCTRDHRHAIQDLHAKCDAAMAEIKKLRRVISAPKPSKAAPTTLQRAIDLVAHAFSVEPTKAAIKTLSAKKISRQVRGVGPVISRAVMEWARS